MSTLTLSEKEQLFPIPSGNIFFQISAPTPTDRFQAVLVTQEQLDNNEPLHFENSVGGHFNGSLQQPVDGPPPDWYIALKANPSVKVRVNVDDSPPPPQQVATQVRAPKAPKKKQWWKLLAILVLVIILGVFGYRKWKGRTTNPITFTVPPVLASSAPELKNEDDELMKELMKKIDQLPPV